MKSMSVGAEHVEGAEAPVLSSAESVAGAAHRPALYMLGIVGLCLAAIVVTLVLSLHQPWLGLRFGETADGGVVVTEVTEDGPGAAIRPGSRVVTLRGATGAPIALEAGDIIHEPDVLGTYAEVERFLHRQDQLSAMLHGGEIAIGLDGGQVVTVRPTDRPLQDLPADFWVQLLTGAGSLLICGWVYAIRPRDWPPRLFMISGIAMVLSAHAAAIYSSRELAIGSDLFRVLSALNFVGSLGFGGTAMALFLLYPRPLVRPALLLAIPAVLVPVVVLDVLRVPENQSLLRYVPIAATMAMIVAFVATQWFATRRDAAARAALRWLGLTISIGAGCFILVIAAPALSGFEPVMSQGYAFGFFLLIYLGIALGLRRYRLFAIGEWSFRVLFYGGAVFAMLLLDAGLIYLLQLGHESSLGLSLILVAFLYLPLRDYLWRRTVARKRMPEAELFRAVVEVAFSASPAERAGRWQKLLVRLFDPLEVQSIRDPVGTVRLLNDGTEMRLPPTADGPALMLRHPFGGRSLFSPVHLGLARQITHLLAEAEVGRHAYERGATEERQRISRDLHDDVGARLLSGLHRGDIGETRKILREAIADIRTIAGALAGDRLPLSSVLADLRHETAQRVEAAGLALDWPLADEAQLPEVMVDYALYRHLVSAVREVISNCLRHASAQRISVAIDWDNRRLRASIADDGVGLGGKGSGNGLRNLSDRMRDIGGWIDFPPVEAGTRVTLAIPLHAKAGAA
ncbi:sensor histidine kinase [Zavarzinia aquatilis]|uniref:PDZ domain-containing protein n=1 Tax=Zavarzinia aquatilis TaxID=2211142 RepID=A0A317EIT1_9PROT|nr:ATP-binding protein [Zavarzinia aquatilis]PWR25980.1 hypothetical protein DKG74_03265 [Zavarzinia aquatilis]